MPVVIEWIKIASPWLVSFVGATAILSFIARGFSYGNFHYSGWSFPWLRNGDRAPHRYEITARTINPDARALARTEREWRRRVQDVRQDPKRDLLRVDFIGQEDVSLEFARMIRRVVGDSTSGCSFLFRVLDGAGQGVLINELNGAICDYIEDLIKKGEPYRPPPIRVISEVREFEAPNQALARMLENAAIVGTEGPTWKQV